MSKIPFLSDDEVIIWQGRPRRAMFKLRDILNYELPGVILLCLWGGWLNNELVQKISGFINSSWEPQAICLVMAMGLLAAPILFWFFYYKRIAYVFTEKRAVCYDENSGKISHQVEAADIPKMKRTELRDGFVSLHLLVPDSDSSHEGAHFIRVEFEGIPAHVPASYEEHRV